MRQIIDRKLYDTETAELIHEWWNGYGYGDFKHRVKDLYRTKKGSWFLYHRGGPMTDMATQAGSGSFSGSEKIEPVDEKDVIGFLESHGGTEVLLKFFPDAIEEA